MTEKDLPKLSPEAERDSMISLAVGNCISKGYDEICAYLDGLHSRGISDAEIVAALREQGEIDVLDWYAEWAGIDIREDDNTTLNPDAVTDPGDAPSYLAMMTKVEMTVSDVVERIDNGIFYAERGPQSGKYNIYKRRSDSDNGAYITSADTPQTAAQILASLGDGHVR